MDHQEILKQVVYILHLKGSREKKDKKNEKDALDVVHPSHT